VLGIVALAFTVALYSYVAVHGGTSKKTSSSAASRPAVATPAPTWATGFS